MNSVGLRLCPVRRPRSLVSCKRLARAMHTPRELAYKLEDGLGEFLPPPALKTVAVDFQHGLLEKLNDEVRDTPEQGLSVAQTVINTAPHRSKTLAFNYASLALNNSFFLDMLKPPSPTAPTHEAGISPMLGAMIRTEHGDLAQLKSNFSAAALGMASSGWVWYVTDSNGRTAVLPTFGAGTLLVRSRANISSIPGPVLGEDFSTWQMSQFMTTPRAPSTSTKTNTPTQTQTQTSDPRYRQFHTSSPTHRAADPDDFSDLTAPPSSLHGNTPPDPEYPPAAPRRTQPTELKFSEEIITLGEMICPLFCISVHEHAWMSAGYGVWGKEEWLKKFWTVLDWSKVSQTYGRFSGKAAA